MKHLLLSFILLIGCYEKQFPIISEKHSFSVTDTSDILGIDSYGQSLSVGGNGGNLNSVVSTTQNYNSIMFNLGVRSSDFKAGTTPSSFVPLVENVSKNLIMGETPCSGAADMFKQTTPAYNYQIFAVASGQSNQEIDSLSKGSRYYNRLINDITNANTIANSIGKTFSMGAVFYTQGEADYTIGTSYNDYRDKLITLMNDINSDVMSITGQSKNTLLIISQVSSQNRTTLGMANAYISLAQLEVAQSYANATLSTPMYMFDFLSDNTHLADTTYRILGAYKGYALKKLEIDGTKNFIYPLSYNVSGPVATISFNVPYGPLVFDTLRVTNPGNYGFTAKDSSGNSMKIKSVQVVGNSVVITCPRKPKTITYAINGTSKRAGRTLGPRGNLRDSQGDILMFENWRMDNWCPIFSISF